MTTPNNQPPSPAIPFSITGTGSATDGSGTSAADLISRTQDTITQLLKETEIFGSEAWNAASTVVYDGLRAGISLPLAIIEAVVNRLFGTNIDFTNMATVLEAIEQVPVIGNLITIIEQLTGVNLETIFNGLDLTNPGSIVTAIENAVIEVIQAITNVISGLAADTPLALAFALAQNAAQDVLGVAGAVANAGSQILGTLATLQGQINVNSSQINALQTATSTTATGNSITFNGSLQSEWTVLTGTAAFNAGALQPTLPFAAYYDVAPATDTHGITFQVVNKIWGTMRGIICADTAFDNYAALEVYTDGYGNDYVRIVTGSSPLTAVATSAQYNGNITGGYTYSFEYQASTNTYIVNLNSTNQILTWTDSSNLVTHGSSKRTTGLAMAVGSWGYGGQGFGVSSYHVYDWTP